MPSKRDYYDILGVSKNATDDELKKSYRRLAKEYHPDVKPGDKDVEAKFKELSEAYAILSDPQKKAAYDQYGHAAFDGGMGGGGFTTDFDINDIFRSAFGDGFGGFASDDILGNIFGGIFGGGQKRRSGPRRGSDSHVNIQIEFEEAVFGCEKDLKLNAVEYCEACKGTGAKPGTAAENCKKCGGSGQERVQQQNYFGGMSIGYTTCSACRGEGKIIKEPCTACRGNGKVHRNKTLSVSVPKGIDSGQAIRITGKGNPGENGGGYGDLLITVYLKPHKYFTRKGQNIYARIPINIVQASLGDEMTVDTLYGGEKLVIKPGTQPGTVVTLRGKGVPNVRNERVVGDMVITLDVAVPTQLTEKQKDLLRQFADLSKEKKGGFGKQRK